jgi:hypothetical protein
MPRAFDPHPLKIDYNPLEKRTNLNPGDLAQQKADLIDRLLFSWIDAFIEAFKELTGIDLREWIQFLERIAAAFGFVLEDGLKTIDGFLIGLEDWAGKAFQDVVKIIKDLTGIDLNKFGDLITSILGAFGITPPTGPVTIESLVTGITTWVGGLFSNIVHELFLLTEIDFTNFPAFLRTVAAVFGITLSPQNSTIAGLFAAVNNWVQNIFTMVALQIKNLTGIDVTHFGGFLDDLAGAFGINLGSDPTQFTIAHFMAGIESWVSGLFSSIANEIHNLTGIDLTSFSSFVSDLGSVFNLNLPTNPTISDFITALQHWVDGIPIVGDFVLALTGQGGGNLQTLGLWAERLLTSGSLIPAQNIYGQLSSSLLGLIPASHIGDVQPNLLVNGSFDTADSLSGGGYWNWDQTHDHTGNGGGAARLDPKAAQRDLMSDLIAVTPNQQLAMHGWLMWSGVRITGSGAFHVGLTCYSDEYGTNIVLTPDLASDPSSASDGGWRQLSGTFQVPTGVKSVRLRLTVTSIANGGSVWWDDLSLSKTGQIPQSLVNGLESALAGFQQNLSNLVDGLVSTLEGLPVVGTAFKALFDALGIVVSNAQNAIDGTKTVHDDLQSLRYSLNGTQGSPADLFTNPAGFFATIPQQIVPAIGTTIDNIVNTLGNAFLGNNFQQADLEHAFLTQNDAILGNTRAIQQILAGQSGGAQAFDDFNRPNQGAYIGSWAQLPVVSRVAYLHGGGGYPSTDGNNLVWTLSANNAAETSLLRWVGNNAHSGTDYQNVSIVLSSQGQDPLLGWAGEVHLLARVSDDGQNYCRVRITSHVLNNDALQIFYCVGGVETLLYSARLNPIPGSGTRINYLCGLKGSNARTHTVVINSQPVAEITESSAGSLVGYSYRGWGLGLTAGYGWDNPTIFNLFNFQQSLPPAVNQWSGVDQ